MISRICCVLFLVAMTTLTTSADRSFYAPLPVNIPGLLPRFGGGSQGNQDAAPVTRAPPRAQPQRPSRPSNGGNRGGNNGLGTRFGETDPPCSPSVPCYDCLVYVSRSGQITRFTQQRSNDISY